MRRPRGFVFFVVMAGCNGLLGIDEPKLRDDAGGANLLVDGGSGDGTSRPSDGSLGDSGGEGGDGAGPPPPFTCTLLAPPAQASVGDATSGPSLAFLAGTPDRWGLAWYTAPNTIKYNVVNSQGVRLGAQDQILAQAVNTDYDQDVRLARTGQSFLLAAGVALQGSKPHPALALVDPLTGIPSTLTAGADDGAGTLPSRVGGVAVNDLGTRIAVTSREYSGAAVTATNATVKLFSPGTPPSYSTTSPGAPAFATSVAWMASGVDRFGVALITLTGGKVDLYDADLTSKGSHEFIDGAKDVPQTQSGEVAIAAADKRFAIAWVDKRDVTNDNEIYLTSIDASTGVRVSKGEVLVSEPSARRKRFPRIVYDGKSLLVAWIEAIAQGSAYYDIKFRRYSPELDELVPMGTKTPQRANANAITELSAPSTGFGVAVGGKQNEYGFAFSGLAGSTRQFFNHMVCSGP
jgi:hypothetical protein